MIEVKSFTFNPFQENTYVLYDQTKSCIIIDPGCSTSVEVETLTDFIKSNGLTPDRIVLTHGHIDHVMGNKAIADYYGLEIACHDDDLFLIEGAPQWGLRYGIVMTPSPSPTISLQEDTYLEFGESQLLILKTPGHSPGSLSFYAKEEGFVIAGDVLFKESIGRTDLPMGDHNTLLKSIEDKLFPLPEPTIVYNGHGPSTTIIHEKVNNPFFR